MNTDFSTSRLVNHFSQCSLSSPTVFACARAYTPYVHSSTTHSGLSANREGVIHGYALSLFLG